MEFTGERFVPEIHGNIELEHIHRYLAACQIAEGKAVLDIASGEGYGSALLARSALNVTGVDISLEAVLHAESKYQMENLSFKVGSCSKIPLEDASVELVVSFETIEHHYEHEAMMREIKRVLSPGGVVIISSPDKLEFSDKPGTVNPHHVKELYRDEFSNLVGAHFKNYNIYGQRVLYGSAILCESGASICASYELDEHMSYAISGVPHAVYLIAVASDAPLPSMNSGVLEQRIEDTEITRFWRGLMSERDGQIANLHHSVAERDVQITNLNHAVAERDVQITNLNHAVAERDVQITNLNHAVVERDVQITNLAAERAQILNSLSWKITQPLRFIRRKFGF